MKMYLFAGIMQVCMPEKAKEAKAPGNVLFKNKNFSLFAWRENNGFQNLKHILLYSAWVKK